MAMHGDYLPPELGNKVDRTPPPAPGLPEPPQRPFEYGNLFGTLTRGDAFAGFTGTEPVDVQRMTQLLGRLAKRMESPFAWGTPEQVGFQPDDNPGIPSGYTYLTQLIAHDLSHVATSLPVRLFGEAANTNLRREKLSLETLYGGGPLESPSAYVFGNGRDALRNMMRLGLVNSTDEPARDIPRAACPHLNETDRKGLPEVLIADQRNDDNVILSQFTALFHLLHNGVLAVLPPASESKALQGRLRKETERFERTQFFVGSLYRRIIAKDVLKRLMDPQVYSAYTGSGWPPKLVSDGMNNGNGVPVEFSHAAIRIGHSMVRSGYVLNAGADSLGIFDIVTTTSARRPGFMPLKPDWIVQWSRFFDMGVDFGEGPKFNASRRIHPNYTHTLTRERLAPSFDDSGTIGLQYRDLIRCASVPMRSVRSIIDILRKDARLSPIIAAHPLLNDPAQRKIIIRDWLTLEPGTLTADDIDMLSGDPPLHFFVLFEAAQLRRGLSLGPVGSAIIGEVMLGILKQPNPPVIWDAASHSDVFDEMAATVCQGEAPPEDMPGLIRLVDRLCKPAQGGCPFI
jgi:hypothetical protein